MTQVRFSIELEDSLETVSIHKKEMHYPSFAQLCRMPELFHTSIDYLMGLSENFMRQTRRQVQRNQFSPRRP